MRFSKTTQCFYPEDFSYLTLPADLITCTDEDYTKAMNRQSGAGLDVQNGRIAIVPPAAPTIAQIKAQKWEQIKSIRDKKMDSGGYVVAGKWFHSDQKSRSQQTVLWMMGGNIPSSLKWKTMDGSFVDMTQALAGQVVGAATASDIALFAKAENLKAAVNAASDPNSIDVTDGWPKGYGE